VRYLLDTNVLSEFSRVQPDPLVTGWVLRQPHGDLAVSSISVGEIQKGVLLLPPGKRRAVLARWLDEWLMGEFLDRSIPVDIPIGREWGRSLAESIQAGRALSFADGVLLATAKIRQLVVVTRNERDFRGRGVDVLNPWNA
jgi:predicted nucleic acid-binding protein